MAVVLTCGNCGCERGTSAHGCRCVPEEFWQRLEVQAALESRDVTRIVRLLRTHTDLSQDALARMTGLSQGMLSQMESGQRSLRSDAKKRRALDGLGASSPGESPSSGTRVSAASKGFSQERFASLEPVEPASSSDPTSAAVSLAFLRALPDAADDLAIDLLTDELRRLAAAYVYCPLPSLVTQFVAVRDSAVKHYQAGTRPRHTQQLLLVVGTSTLLLAHAAQNLGDNRAATSHLTAAGRCAEHAEHDQLRSWVLGSAALFAEWLPDPRTAAERASHAYRLAPRGHTGVRAAAIEARAAARIGDRARALAALDRLHQARATEPVSDDLGVTIGGLFAFPIAKQEFYQGSTHLLLGEADVAQQHATTALEMYRSGPEHERSYGDEALARIDVITARLRLGDAEGADRELSELLELPQEQRIQQLAPAIATLYRTLTQPRSHQRSLDRGMAERVRQYRVLDASRTQLSLPLHQ